MSKSSPEHLTAGRAASHSLGPGGGIALERLWALAAVLTVGSGVFGLINLLKLQGSERLLIVSYNFALCFIFLALWLRLIQRRILERWVDPLAAGVLLLGFSNVLLTFLLVSEPLQNNLVAVYIIATGCFLFSGRLLAATIGIMLTAWAPAAWYVASSANGLIQFALTLLAASLLAAAIHTGRRRADRRFRKSESRYRRLFQQSKDAVAISTPGGRLLDINQAGIELFGYDSENDSGMDLESFDIARDTYADPKERERLVTELLDKGFVKDRQSVLRKRSGELIHIEGTTATIQDDNGRVTAFLAILRDITTRKREQEELARHREQLEELVLERTARLEEEMAERKRSDKERLQLERQFHEAQKLESLGVLAGGIAHDFNNLLVGMMGNASLIRGELPEDSPHLPNLTQIEVAAKRAAELANQMLAYAGQGQFLFATCDLGRIVKEVAGLLQTSISKKAILDLGFANDLPAIRADITQVRQVVMNLITNASDALSGESGTITVRTRVVDIDRDTPAPISSNSDLSHGRHVCLEVSDTGCGMDEATKAKIFDPFFSTKFDGRGLGLAAALGIVRGHGGSIEVKSAPDRGSTFQLLFPASDEQVETAADRQPAIDTLTGASGTILMVDDEEIVRLVSRAVLKQAGFDVLVAEDGRRAVETFSQHGEDIDLVLLDSKMPEMDGAQTFHELRRLQPDVKVILCSGDPEVKATRGLDGLAGFVSKPYEPPDLIRMVYTALEVTPRVVMAEANDLELEHGPLRP